MELAGGGPPLNRNASLDFNIRSFEETLASLVWRAESLALAPHDFGCRPSISRKRPVHICRRDELLRADDVVSRPAFAARLEQSHGCGHSYDFANRSGLSWFGQVS